MIRRWNKGSTGNIFKMIEDVEIKLAELEEICADKNELVMTKMLLEELYRKKGQHVESASQSSLA